MIQLEYLSLKEKNIIGQIVDGYLLSYKNMKDNSLSIHNSPGLWLFSLFNNFDDLKDQCHISLSNKGEELAAEFFIKDCPDSSYFFQQLNLKKAEFMARVVFIESLFKEDLIFFEEDKNCSMPKYEEPSDEKKREFQDENLSHYTDVIKSQFTFDFINKYYWSRVIPSPNLIEFRNKNYKTPEQIRNKRNSIISITGIIVAILISIFSMWWSSTHSNVSINDRQLDKILQVLRNDTIINKNILTIYGKVKNENP